MNKSRNCNFDIVRIVAVTFVFLVHLGQYVNIGIIDTANGFYGVWLFFILSGYLITASLDKERNTSLLNFFYKRFVRIIPAYFFALVILWIYNLLRLRIVDGIAFSDLLIGGACSVKYLRYFLFLQMFIPSSNFEMWNNMYGLWTMSAFAFFYIIAPFIKKLAHNFYASLACLYIFCLIKTYLPGIIRNRLAGNANIDLGDFPELNVLCVMYIFYFGVCAYYAVKENKHLQFIILIIFVNSFKILDISYFAVIFTLFVIAAAVSSPLKLKPFMEKAVYNVSKASFYVYLTHIFAFDMVSRLYSYIGLDALFIKLIVSVAAAFLVAYLMFRIIVPIEDKLAKKANLITS